MSRVCLFVFGLLFVVGCGGDTAQKATGSGRTVKLAGAGATFPRLIFEKWFADYSKQNADVRIEYQAIGSGGGVSQLTNETVDFSASDDGMTEEQIGKIARGVQMIPITAGTVVLAYNLPGVTSPLKLSRAAYAGIFLGKITRWNDPAIAKTNEGVKLPDQTISIVHRSDSSGTTAVFTSHLAAISPEWKSGPGTGKQVKWPVGSGAKGNDQVIAQIKQTPGAVGYVEYGYAREEKVPMAALENKAGKFVAPSPESGKAALAKIQLPENLRGFEPNPEGEDSYPIVTFSWMLLYKSYRDESKVATIKKLVTYCLTKGQEDADAKGYLPLPENVVQRAVKAVEGVSAKTGG